MTRNAGPHDSPASDASGPCSHAALGGNHDERGVRFQRYQFSTGS
jgi:hypothetical protein